MSTTQQFKRETEGASKVATRPRLLTMPPNFFAITIGLAGLACGGWRAGELYHLPAAIGDTLYVIAATVYLFLLIVFVMKLVLTPMAPPVVAGNAYSTLTSGRIDLLAYVLADYAVLMVLVQLRLAPLYRKTPFAPSFWAFTFLYASVASDAMRWMEFEHTVGRLFLGSVLLTAIILLIGGIAFRSLIALRQSTFLPTS